MKQTILHPVYRTIPGARLIDFGGWELPVQFDAGITAEHLAVREKAGIFDISHMGEILVKGSESFKFLNELLPAKLNGKSPGRCVYTPMCNPQGGVIDDLLIYIISETEYLLVVNAANIDKDFAWIAKENPVIGRHRENVSIENLSPVYVQIAVQGPLSSMVVSECFKKIDHTFNSSELDTLPFYRFIRGSIAGIPSVISRTGYTGEDGYEIYLQTAGDDQRNAAVELWGILEKEVRKTGGVPCGLGARDTLRLEACLPLYGHELGTDISPVEAGLSKFMDFEKEFIGKGPLLQQKERGTPKKLMGVRMKDKGVPRQGCPVYKNGTPLGIVTSGTKSPVLDQFIGLILIEYSNLTTGDEIEIEINNKLKKAEIVSTPFYSRRK